VAQVLIRQLDDGVVERLRRKAKCRGLSLEQSLRDLLTEAAREPQQHIEELAHLRQQTPPQGRDLNVAELIRSAREQR
jgi:plasmid stability protein